MSIAAEFAHPLEGAGPILVPMVLGLHPFMWCGWLCWEQGKSYAFSMIYFSFKF